MTEAKCLTCGETSGEMACPRMFAGAAQPLKREAVALLGETYYVLGCVLFGCYWQPVGDSKGDGDD